MKRLIAILATTLRLGAPLGAAEIEVAPNDSHTSVSIGNKGKEELIIFAGVHEMQGRVAVCGMLLNMARFG